MFGQLMNHDDQRKTRSKWEMHLEAGRMAYEAGYFVAASRNYQHALVLAEELSLCDELLAKNLFGLAECYFELQNFAKAEELYKRALHIDESACNANEQNCANDLNDLAKLYLKVGNPSTAEMLRSLSLTISEQLGKNHQVDLATTLKNLGVACLEQYRLDEAHRYLTKAFVINDMLRNKRLSAEILVDMAKLEAKSGNVKEAHDLIQQAIAIFEIATGGRHPQLADFLEVGAQIMVNEGLSDQAQLMQERAQTIREQVRQLDF